MKSFKCTCGNTVFFENNQCMGCGSELGWCPGCKQIAPILAGDEGYRCGNAHCGIQLTRCHNYSEHAVCNRCAVATDSPAPVFCDYCRFNSTIPDLAVEGTKAMWNRLETSKRRLLYTLDLLQLPYGDETDGIDPPLSFDFKSDIKLEQKRWWWVTSKEERVYTGHANGKITINLREADDVERTRARVAFDEAHRTVIGHFRHEIGHYYWDLLIKDRQESEFRAVFGDHESPGYGEAQQRYYAEGPVRDWQSSFISAYASMHPWEDFAEVFGTYLDMCSVLDTALNMGVVAGIDPRTAPLQEMIERYMHLGVVLNEMNRAQGLIDLVPEVFNGPVITKLAYLDRLVKNAPDVDVTSPRPVSSTQKPGLI